MAIIDQKGVQKALESALSKYVKEVSEAVIRKTIKDFEVQLKNELNSRVEEILDNEIRGKK